jgi:rhodanese-related sulfurtransferase
MSFHTVSASKLPELLEKKERIIDVRTPAEYNSAHVKGAVLLPLDSLDPEAFCLQHEADSAVYILCQSGKRSEMAAEKLRKAGQEKIYVVEGGTRAAMEAGVDIVRGKKSISIERQVRIAAGLLVFFGTLAGAFLHGGFLILPAFVGAGLVFAGITDTCGMGMLLAKCPWNR